MQKYTLESRVDIFYLNSFLFKSLSCLLWSGVFLVERVHPSIWSSYRGNDDDRAVTVKL